MTIESLEAELLRVNQNLLEAVAINAEARRDLLESQQERTRLTAELKEREKELSEAHRYAVVLNKMLRRK